MKPNPIQWILIFTIFSLTFSCKEKSKEKDQKTMIKDWHSAAKPEEAVVTHEDLDLKIDFEKKVIEGIAMLSVWNKSKGTELYIDTRNLEITNIFLEKAGNKTEFEFLEEKPFVGKPLKINISNSEKQKVIIVYKTTQNSDALQWLEPSQTAGKKHPFLFTQGQAILSRTWFPCQDSPGIRFTWSANVTLKNELEAIMSSEIRSTDSTTGLYHFEMPKPVPAYLVALAAGNLAFQKIDDRTGVFAEPEMLEKSAYEFGEMGKMVSAAEKLYGQYRWGRYDVLVLPPSFPFGGMENPCVTFATPTILAGDRSLTSLIAHELAHSWSGNLVTNATWDDFWLNEGFTVYFERRIMEELEGKNYADMLAVLGHQELTGTLEDLGNKSESTHLKLKLTGKDPDDGMNDIAYEKGYLFLCHLERLVGREKWDAFVKKYFDDNAFQSMTTESFVEYLKSNLLHINQISEEKAAVASWIYQPGLPAGYQIPSSLRFQSAGNAAQKFGQTGKIDKSQTQMWSSHEWLHFLRALPKTVDKTQMAVLDDNFNFTQSGNNEILFEWLNLSIKNQYLPAYPAMDKFLTHIGRRKFVLPLYKELLKTQEGKALATKIFDHSKANYHSVTRQSVEGMF